MRGIHRDRWIPRTNSQQRGKSFHLTTSPCVAQYQDHCTNFSYRNLIRYSNVITLTSHEPHGVWDHRHPTVCLTAFSHQRTDEMLALLVLRERNTPMRHYPTDLQDLWWRHPMDIFSALLVFCAGNSQVTGEFPAERPVTRSFDVFFDLRLNKRLSKQSWGWWFEMP